MQTFIKRTHPQDPNISAESVRSAIRNARAALDGMVRFYDISDRLYLSVIWIFPNERPRLTVMAKDNHFHVDLCACTPAEISKVSEIRYMVDRWLNGEVASERRLPASTFTPPEPPEGALYLCDEEAIV